MEMVYRRPRNTRRSHSRNPKGQLGLSRWRLISFLPLWLLLLSPLFWVPSHSQRLEALGLPLPFLLWLSPLLGILACSVDLFMLYMGRRAPQFHPQL